MQMPDVNVLVYAHRQEQETHRFYRDWLEQLARKDAPFALSVLVAAGFVRVVTQDRFPAGRTPREDAFNAIATLLELPNCRLIGPAEQHWEVLRALCDATGTRGAKISDAQHAAVAIEHGCTLVSRDADFGRFRPHGLDFELLEP